MFLWLSLLLLLYIVKNDENKDDQSVNQYHVFKPRRIESDVIRCQRPSHCIHDDVIKWKHWPRYWSFVWGIHRSPVNSPHKGQWRGALVFSLICAWIHGWVNNRGAGDLRRHRAHYDATVMCSHSEWYYYVHRITPIKTLWTGVKPITFNAFYATISRFW